MCGINGLFLLNGRLPADGASLIEEMNNRIRHRGPDDAGNWSDEARGIWLGHRRLSILDLSPAGHQPMHDDAGNTIVFNGEIYNFKELKKALTGIHFKSNSDTEVLMALYAKHKHNCLPDLNGMFAFAWWNKQEEKLYLAKDRAGKKPLYYSVNNGIFAFSSEIKALLSLPWIKAEADDESIYHFLTFNQLDAPHTLFKGISKLEPGSCMVVGRNGIEQISEWAEIEYKNLQNLSEEELADKTYETLKQSVDYRLVSDVPVGAFLSGGVDSSAVVALMRNAGTQSIKTYSVGFEGQEDFDERKYAEAVSKKFGTTHFEKIVTANDIAEFLPNIINIFDEPMADATCIPIYFISELARANGTIVVQTGDGADELYAGYRGWMKYAKAYPYYQQYKKIPGFIKSAVAALTSAANEDSPVAEIFQRGAKNQEFFWGGAKAFKESSKAKFLHPAWKTKMAGVNSYSQVELYRSEFQKLQNKYPWLGDLDWMCYLGYKQQIPWKYLYRMDRIGMHHSIEVRNPFLDYHVVNLALSTPPEYKIKNGVPKYILKKSLERILPDEVLYRKKMGFCVPLKAWGNEIMFDYVENNLKSFCSDTGIFDEKGMRVYLNEIKNGKSDATNNLWTVYFMISWFKRWMHI